MRIHTVNFGSMEIPDDRVITFQGRPAWIPADSSICCSGTGRTKALPVSSGSGGSSHLSFCDQSLYRGSKLRIPANRFRYGGLNSTNSAELAVYAVATIPEDPNEATLNLMASDRHQWTGVGVESRLFCMKASTQ